MPALDLREPQPRRASLVQAQGVACGCDPLREDGLLLHGRALHGRHHGLDQVAAQNSGTHRPYYRKDGHWYLGASPSRKSVQRLKDRVGELLVPSNTAPWGEVRDRLNQQLRGWANYFAYGTRLMAYRAVDHHVHATVRG